MSSLGKACQRFLKSAARFLDASAAYVADQTSAHQAHRAQCQPSDSDGWPVKPLNPPTAQAGRQFAVELGTEYDKAAAELQEASADFGAMVDACGGDPPKVIPPNPEANP